MIIYGNGETTRDFCYIANVVQANLLAAAGSAPDAANQVYNVALNKSTPQPIILRSSKSLKQRIPSRQKSRPIYGPFRLGDIRQSQADISRAEKLLGYISRRSTSNRDCVGNRMVQDRS